MNINTGQIYPSFDLAIADGNDERDLVSGHRETLEELRRRLKLDSKYEPHQGLRERKRRAPKS